MKEKSMTIVLICIVVCVFIPWQMSFAIDSVTEVDYSSVSLEDHDWLSSSDYYLTDGDQIGVEINVTSAADANADLTIYLETPDHTGGATFYLLMGYVSLNEGNFYNHWTVLSNFGDSEGIHAIHITNKGTFAGGDSITVDVRFWKFSNTLADGDILIPSENERVEGNVTISWDFLDSDSGDTLAYYLYYANYITTNPDDPGTFIGGTSSDSLVWDTSGLADGSYTVLFRVYEFQGEFNWDNYFLRNYYFLHLELDNTNDRPSLTISNPQPDQSYSNTLEIQYSASDPNEDDLTFSLQYAADGINFDHNIITDVSETTYNWNISSLSDGEDYRIKVIVEDEHGLTKEAVTSKFTIDNPEYLELITPNVTVYEDIQTVSIATNAESVELFLNGVSKGTQTTGFSWTVSLKNGTNLIEFVMKDSLGSETRKTYTVSRTEQPTTTAENLTSDFNSLSFFLLVLTSIALYNTRKRRR